MSGEISPIASAATVVPTQTFSLQLILLDINYNYAFITSDWWQVWERIFGGSIQDYQQIKHFHLHVLHFIQRDEQLNAQESRCRMIARANKMIWGKTTEKWCAGAADKGILIGAGHRKASEEIFQHLFLSFPGHLQSQQGQNINLRWKSGGFSYVEPHATILRVVTDSEAVWPWRGDELEERRRGN